MAETLTPAHVDLLSRAKLFSELDRIALTQLAGYVELVAVPKGQDVVHQGDRGDAMYIVASGSFDVFLSTSQGQQRETRLGTLAAGDVFGEMALLNGEARSATVRAAEDSALLKLDNKQFQGLVAQYPGVATAIMTVLADRLRSANVGWAERDQVVATGIDRLLGSLPAERRRRVLEAGLLDRPDPKSLETVFDENAPAVGGDLALVAGTEGIPSKPIIEALRVRFIETMEPDELRDRMSKAAERLALAGDWDQALAVASRTGRPEDVITALGRGLRALPPMSPETARTWASRIRDEDAIADADIALAKADAHEADGDPDRGLRLLRQALGHQMTHGTDGAPRLSEALARISASPGAAAAPDGARVGIGLRGRNFPALGSALALIVAACLVGAVFALDLGAQWDFVLLLGAAACFWVVDLVPDYVVAIGLILAWVLGGIAPAAVAMSGFASTEWAFVLAVLGISAAVARSGLLFRIGLLLARHMPSGLFGQAATLLGTGILLSPVLPQAKGRIALIAPLALAVADARRLPPRDPAAAVLGLAAWIGASPLMYIFLNGSTVTLLAWGLLPAESRNNFTWLNWFIAAAPLGIFVMLSSFLVLRLALRPGKGGPESRERVALQLAVLGPMTRREKLMIALLLGTVSAWVIAPSIGLDLAIVGLGGLIGAFLIGCFETKTLQSLDWSYLLFFGVALAIGRLAVSLGIDQIAASQLGDWLGPAATDPLAFVMFVALATMVVRLLVPQSSGVLLLIIALMPLAWGAGVDPWIVVITVLATSNMWFLPQQTSSYLIAYSLNQGRLYSHAQARLVSFGYAAVTLVGLFFAVLYWHVIGLI